MKLRPSTDRPLAGASLRALAIDGGGIRGVIPAVFLARLEELLSETLQSAKADPARASVAARWREVQEPRVADCFHLIAGTSTGGLLAAGLTVTDGDRRPRLSAADAVEIYRAHGARIFSRPLWRNLLDHWNLIVPRYPLSQLRKVLEEPSVLGGGLLRDARTDVLITSYDAHEPGPRVFTRWGTPGAGASPEPPPETMAEAALASAAAPTYFEPEALGRQRLVDGGVYAGNPALAAISLALRRTDEPAPAGPQDIVLISLGTGAWERPLDYGRGGIIGWLRPRKGGEALLEALLGGQGDFASEAAHMILNGWPATSLPNASPSAAPMPPNVHAGTSPGSRGPIWWQASMPRESVGGGPRFWRYQALLPEPWAMDDVSRLPELQALGAGLAERYHAELQRLAAALIDAGPVP